MTRLPFLVFTAVLALGAADNTSARVRAWRLDHEKPILLELFDFLSIPNVAANKGDIERNAQALTRMFEHGRFLPERIATSGSPVVLAEPRSPNLRRTITFYFHYDGQPVDPTEWTYEPPFSPVIVVEHEPAGRTLTLKSWQGPIDPEWRIYGRSSSDDKSPIMAFLAAVDALEDSNIALTSNIRVIMAGDDDVTPLTAEERQAIDAIPDVAPMLMQTFGFSQPETTTERLELRHNLPTLNINALDAGGGVGGQGRTVIPASASARLDLRLVKAIDPVKQFDRLVAHVRKQGFFIVDKEPDAATRAAHPWIARVTRSGGYPAGRTPMNLPIAAAISKALSDAAGGPIVRLPTIGGSAPFYVFTHGLKVPTLRVSVVNFDNNQHGPNENLRIQNLWEGIESMAALLTMP